MNQDVFTQYKSNDGKSNLSSASENKKENLNSFSALFSIADNRPEAIIQRKLKSLVNESPRMEIANQLISAANNYYKKSSKTAHTDSLSQLNNNTVIPSSANNMINENMADNHLNNNIQTDKPLQFVRLSPAEAAAQANQQRTQNPNNRGAMTNDWILANDEASTIAAWQRLAPNGVIYNGSNSITNGGQSRPTSIDLKAKSQGAFMADFIFHLPKFTGIQDMVNYLMNSSGIARKQQDIDMIRRINLNNATDFELEKIESAPKINISSLTNNPIYTANSAEIEAAFPNFLVDLQNNVITPRNQILDNVRDNQIYKNKLANKKARETKTLYNRIFIRLNNLLPVEPQNFDMQDFTGVEMYVGLLDRYYSMAKDIFSNAEQQDYEMLKYRFARVEAKKGLQDRFVSGGIINTKNKSE